MKRLMAAMAAMTILATGCDMSPDQIKALSSASGTAAAVLWISYDNPTTAQKAEVSKVISIVTTNIGIVGSNSYVAVMMPKIQTYVNTTTDIPAIDKPLVLAGSLAVLGGIDLMFASHPTWKTDTQNVGGYVKEFLTGAQAAFGLPETDPQIVQAAKNHASRSALKK